MQFKNFFEADRYKKHKRQEIENNVLIDSKREFGSVDPVIFKYFFALQSKIEKERDKSGGGSDYHIYARRMWEDLVGEINPQNEEFFHQFENTMILGLHKINMEPLVYKHLTEQLTELIKQNKESIRHIALWSKGDVEPTGYQISKINSSKIIKNFHKALKAELPKGQAGKFMKENTSYFVTDDKFKALTTYATEFFQKNPKENLKIVIIEDSKNSFDKVKEALVKSLGKEASKVQVVPIWVTYSREGQQAEAKASSSEEILKLQEQKVNLNAVNSFEELLDIKRFGSILKDAHVFVDFDGVIGDNISMREEQARVTYSALMEAAILSTGLTEQELVEKMKSKI